MSSLEVSNFTCWGGSGKLTDTSGSVSGGSGIEVGGLPASTDSEVVGSTDSVGASGSIVWTTCCGPGVSRYETADSWIFCGWLEVLVISLTSNSRFEILVFTLRFLRFRELHVQLLQ